MHKSHIAQYIEESRQTTIELVQQIKTDNEIIQVEF